MAQLSRRQFLRRHMGAVPLLGLISACAAKPATTQGSTAKRSHADVLVIGAGMAGLMAARTLADAGLTVIVLEGRTRIGGRIWTNTDLGVSLDLGASWIHGVEGNPVTALARRYKIKTIVTDYDNGVVYNSDGKRLNKDRQDELEPWLEAVLAEAAEYGEGLEEDTSLQQGIDAVLAANRPDHTAMRELNFILNTMVEHEYAADVGELSLWYWDESEVFDGDDVVFPGGYAQIPTQLAQGLDLRLEQVVQGITYGRSGVTVTTHRGVYTADRCVVSVPLGVLKRGTIEFQPALPAAKQAAIERLGMGVLNKVYLKFPHPFWDTKREFLNYIAARRGEWAEFLNLHYYTGAPVLLGLNAGTYGRAVELLPDRAIVAGMMKTLKTLYGPQIPAPTGYLITRWAQDPFAYGSYSYLPVGSTPADYEILEAPVGGQIFFAGEHTSRDYPSTVHGALLSGQRAARRILEAL